MKVQVLLLAAVVASAPLAVAAQSAAPAPTRQPGKATRPAVARPTTTRPTTTRPATTPQAPPTTRYTPGVGGDPGQELRDAAARRPSRPAFTPSEPVVDDNDSEAAPPRRSYAPKLAPLPKVRRPGAVAEEPVPDEPQRTAGADTPTDPPRRPARQVAEPAPKAEPAPTAQAPVAPPPVAAAPAPTAVAPTATAAASAMSLPILAGLGLLLLLLLAAALIIARRLLAGPPPTGVTIACVPCVGVQDAPVFAAGDDGPAFSWKFKRGPMTSDLDYPAQSAA